MCLMACAQVIFHRAQRKLLQACVQLKGFISLVFPDVQQQPNHYDCGLAICTCIYFKLVLFPDPFRKNREGVWQHVLHCGVQKEFN